MQKQNVLLVTIDCLRADHLPLYGYKRNTAPFLTELAQKATVFDAAFSTGPGTSVSFPTIFSSTYPFDYGGYSGLGDYRTSFVDVLSSEDVTTLGAHSNGYLTPTYGYDRGFDQYKSFTNWTLLDRLTRRAEEGMRVLRTNSFIDLLGDLSALFRQPAPYARADTITDLAIKWSSEMDDDRTFAWFHYMDVHGPYHPPDSLLQEFHGEHPESGAVNDIWRKGLSEPDALTESDVALLTDAYDAEIRFVDEQLRRLFAALEARDVLSDTLIIITADHGEELGEHGAIGHSPKLHDELIHVPLLVYGGPDRDLVPADEIVTLLDIAPTVLHNYDITPPDSYRGNPLHRFDDDAVQGYDHIIAEVSHTEDDNQDMSYSSEDAVVCCRTAEHKYIRNNQSGEEAFHDLERDPNERDPDPASLSDERREYLSNTVDSHLASLYEGEDEGQDEIPDGVKTRLADLGYFEER